MPAGGKIGNKGGGRTSNTKADKLKAILLDAVIDDCQKNPARRFFWAEKMANKLLPQAVETEKPLEVKVHLYASEQIKAIARRAVSDG